MFATRMLPQAQMRLAGSLIVATLVSGSPAWAQGTHSARFDSRDASRMLVGAADADRNGEISAEEQSGFVASLVGDGSAPLETDAVLARSLMGYYDEDGDGALTKSDMAALLGRWDADGNGAISTEERNTGPRRVGLLDGVVMNALDLDLDGQVSTEEWSASSTLALSAWVSTTAAIQEDINGFGPGTMLLTLRATLDADSNGSFDVSDVLQHFANLDQDSNGQVSAAELAPPVRRGGGSFTLTEEQLKRAPGMPWQRSLEDALALSKATGKPLLICVNSDGELASDTLARGRYADPEFIRLAKGFIPILASPNMHTSGARDSQGMRLECPRFGRVVCSEHIDVEPELYRRYFSEQRIAPRHVGVAPDGTILFDLILLGDLSAINRSLTKHGNHDVDLPDPRWSGREELLASRDAASRNTLREHYLSAPEDARSWFLERAMSNSRASQHPELLHLGLYDLSAGVRTVAAQQMIASMSFDLVNSGPRLNLLGANSPELQQSLSKALQALAASSEDPAKIQRPRRLARVFEAQQQPSTLNAELWQLALAGAPALRAENNSNSGTDLERALDAIGQQLQAQPDNAALHAVLAQTTLRMALDAIRGTSGGAAQFLLQDAEAAARRSLELLPGNSLAQATLARCLWWLSRPEEAADAAAMVLPKLIGQAGAPLAGELLDLLAKARGQTLQGALGSEEGWPSHWLPEALSAYEALVRHPSFTHAQALAGVSLMEQLELYSSQAEYISNCMERFPASNELHAWLRWQVLRDGTNELSGAAALQATYDEMTAPAEGRAAWLWYKGLGLQTAGDTFVSQGEPGLAIAPYQDAIQNYEASIELNLDFEASARARIDLTEAALQGL